MTMIEPMLSARILVIDDQTSIHDVFRRVLSTSPLCCNGLDELESSLFGDTVRVFPAVPSEPKYHLEFAHQGDEGLRKILEAQSQETEFDIVFVDMCMPPGWDGIETIRQLWKCAPNLDVIVCTAHSGHSWPEIQQLLGNSDRLRYLPKPFSRQELKGILGTITDSKRPEWHCSSL